MNNKLSVSEIVVLVIAATAVGFLTSQMSSASSDLLPKLVAFVQALGVFSIVVFVGIFSGILWKMKSKFLLVYGVVEILVGGVASVWSLLPQLRINTLELTVILQFSAGVYVIIRGIGNIREAVLARKLKLPKLLGSFLGIEKAS